MSRRTRFGVTVGAIGVALSGSGAAQAQGLTLSVDVPTTQVADWPFDATTTWSTDAPRVLSLAFIRATSCGANLRASLELDPTGLVVVEDSVSGSGTRVDDVTLVRRGSYLACAYLHSSSDPAAPADLVARSPWSVRITSYPASRPRGIACGDVGGARDITRVRAFAVRCKRARRVARRWGRATDREAVGAFKCRTRGRKVRCTAAEGRKVTFRLRQTTVA
jgi:hypothetical protein